MKNFKTSYKITIFSILAIIASIGILGIVQGWLNISVLFFGKWLEYGFVYHIESAIRDLFVYYDYAWWLVLSTILAVILFLIISFFIIEKILLNYRGTLFGGHGDGFRDHSVFPDTRYPTAWLVYYFSIIGFIFGIFHAEEYGLIHSALLLIGLLYLLFASFFAKHNDIGFSIWTFVVLSFYCTLLYSWSFCVSWLALILFIVGICKFLKSLGGISFSSYNKEAESLNKEREELRNNPFATSSDIQDLKDRIDRHNNAL